jgi:pimeloyl-ACP methyl ester carboxylesterase
MNDFSSDGGRPASPVLLVHGSWHSAWHWHEIIDLLTAARIPVRAEELPLTTFEDDVSAVRGALEELGPDVVVCAHSYGGRVVSTALDGGPTVGHLIYVSAPVLDETQLRGFRRARSFDSPDVPPFETARDMFYSELPLDAAREAYAHLRPMTSGVGELRGLELRPWRTVPSTYVVCTRDHTSAPELQRKMAANLNRAVEVEADHSPFLSAPRALARVIAETAGAHVGIT